MTTSGDRIAAGRALVMAFSEVKHFMTYQTVECFKPLATVGATVKLDRPKNPGLVLANLISQQMIFSVILHGVEA